MAYVYLLDLYQLIDRRTAEALQAMNDGKNDPGERKFHEGRIKILAEFKNFLMENFNAKLPRRIRRSSPMVEIHLFGELRRYAPNFESAGDNIIKTALNQGDTIASLLERAGIGIHEIYNLFFNFKLLASRSQMAIWLQYQQLRNNPLDWNLNIPVKSGDRIGLFGRDMAALVI